jgi:hypothetical protein
MEPAENGGRMRKSWAVYILLIMFAVVTSAQRGTDGALNGEQFVGAWSGSWDAGTSSGGFELTLEKGKDGVLGGRVSVTGEPTYKAVLKTLSFDGNRMTAKYDFPLDESAEVTLAASFEGNKADGTWALQAKGTNNAPLTGTWTVTRQ